MTALFTQISKSCQGSSLTTSPYPNSVITPRKNLLPKYLWNLVSFPISNNSLIWALIISHSDKYKNLLKCLFLPLVPSPWQIGALPAARAIIFQAVWSYKTPPLGWHMNKNNGYNVDTYYRPGIILFMFIMLPNGCRFIYFIDEATKAQKGVRNLPKFT